LRDRQKKKFAVDFVAHPAHILQWRRFGKRELVFEDVHAQGLRVIVDLRN